MKKVPLQLTGGFMMPAITIISTYSKDTIIRPGVARETRFSGPAYYIEKAFRANAYPHILTVGRQLETEIEILPNNGGERGRVCGDPFSQPLPKILTPNALISTLGKEWDVKSLKEYMGRVFLDIQGFIRNPAGGMGSKQEWTEAREIADRIFCLKATERELNYLPQDLAISQKAERCLIITKDSRGSEIFYQGKHFVFTPPCSIDNLPDTFGAGDTYLANFTMSFINTGDIEKSGQQATEQASLFLQQKRRVK